MYDQEKVDDFIFRSEEIAKTRNSDEAFKIVSSEIDSCDDKYLNEYIIALNFVRNSKSLDWIENNSTRIINVGENWGHLAALSHFSWLRAEKWLTTGRPLSLISLDAIYFCTTIGERLNQSLLMRQIKPKLIDNPKPEIIAQSLSDYLLHDNVPRTRNMINVIIKYIFDAEQ